MFSNNLDFTQLHLWLANLSELTVHQEWVLERLDSTERLRLKEAKLPEACLLSAACRAFVREVLARNVASARERVIHFTQKGKPYTSGLFLSWSRSEEQALLGLTRTCPLGVDLEHFSHFQDWSAFLRFFSKDERQKLQTLPAESMPQASALLWVRKEAVLKASGLGLAGFEAVSASPKPQESRLTLAEHSPRNWFCPVFLQKNSVFCVAYPQKAGVLTIVRHTLSLA